ncbi:GntR family transcriptional regulator [Lachnospiraceae bacterium]|jgi:GntR family transcriptional regulator|nr:GntR family transcriptional regulator [Lachnospiraceae bacterium]
MDYENWVFHDVTPIYLQLCNKMLYKILCGNLCSGESIPSIREMAKLLHINPNTVAKSYKRLKQEQLITCSRSGKFTVRKMLSIYKIKSKKLSRYFVAHI